MSCRCVVASLKIIICVPSTLLVLSRLKTTNFNLFLTRSRRCANFKHRRPGDRPRRTPRCPRGTPSRCPVSSQVQCQQRSCLVYPPVIALSVLPRSLHGLSSTELKTLCGETKPSYHRACWLHLVRRLEGLHELWGTCRYIHTTRVYVQRDHTNDTWMRMGSTRTRRTYRAPTSRQDTTLRQQEQTQAHCSNHQPKKSSSKSSSGSGIMGQKSSS